LHCSRIPEGSTPVHAAAYGSTVSLLRRVVDLGGDLRLHDVNGLQVRHWAARQLNVSRRSKNLTYLLYAQNRALASIGRPPIDVDAPPALPSLSAAPPQNLTLAYVTHFWDLSSSAPAFLLSDQSVGGLISQMQSIAVIAIDSCAPDSEKCFDTVGWATGRASGLKKTLDVGLLVVMICLELCTTYSSSCPVVTTTSVILCFIKHRLTQFHLENGR